MRRSVTILLIFLILTVSLKDAVVYVSFKIDQKYIAENLCVNRFETITVCMGSCFLKARLWENHIEDETLPAPKTENKPISPFCLNTPCQIVYGRIEILRSFQIISDNKWKGDYSSLLFRPPQS